MNYGRGIAILGLILSFLASIGYLISGDLRRAIYYFAATVVNGSVVL